MIEPLRDAELAWLSAFVADRLGLHLPRGKWGDLEHQTVSAAAEFGFANAQGFIDWLRSSPLSQGQIERLAAHLTISETYFWREPKAFEALRDTILPDLIRARKTGERVLRLWCAGCSTGEEAYSIAFVLRDLIPAKLDWRITVLATDINPNNLRRAAHGVYGDWSFRNAPPGLQEKFFYRRSDDKYEVIPEIRKMVTFAYLNLAEDAYPSLESNTYSMDVIFCRNVLMYFDKERSRQVAQRFYHSLNDGGWLMVAATELSERVFPQYATIRFPGAFVYRREALPLAAVVTTPLPAAPAQRPAPRALVTQPIPAVKTGPPAPHQLAPPNPAMLVRALANQGKLREALAACEHALAADKLNPALHYLHAAILTEENFEAEAKAALKRALYLDPDFVLAHFSLGKIGLRQGNRLAAQKSFENVLALLNSFSPDDILPEAEGLTAGRLSEIARASLPTGPLTP